MCGPLPTIACFHPFWPKEKNILPFYFTFNNNDIFKKKKKKEKKISYNEDNPKREGGFRINTEIVSIFFGNFGIVGIVGPILSQPATATLWAQFKSPLLFLFSTLSRENHKLIHLLKQNSII